MSDPFLNIDTRQSALRSRDGGTDSRPERSAPSSQDIAQFADALARGEAPGPRLDSPLSAPRVLQPSPSEGPAPDGVTQDAADNADARGRMPLPTTDLAASLGDFTVVSSHPAEPRALLDAVTDLVDRVLVGDGQAGRREVRMSLADDVLPGVDIAVYEDAGAWIAEFTCSVPQSWTLLASEADSMAQELADLLNADAIWRVLAIDAAAPQDVVESRANPRVS